MQRFIIEQTEADLISYAGRGLIGMALNERTDLGVKTKMAAPARSEPIPHTDVPRSYIALLSLGKSDFEAVNGLREDDYFAGSLGLSLVPSEGTLRQRMERMRACSCRWSGRRLYRHLPYHLGRSYVACDTGFALFLEYLPPPPQAPERYTVSITTPAASGRRH